MPFKIDFSVSSTIILLSVPRLSITSDDGLEGGTSNECDGNDADDLSHDADDCSLCSGLVFRLILRLNEAGTSGAAIAVPAGVDGVIMNMVLPVQSLVETVGSDNVLKS